jgi:hypothetical protein
VAVNTLLFILLDKEIRERVQEEVIEAHEIGEGHITEAACTSPNKFPIFQNVFPFIF